MVTFVPATNVIAPEAGALTPVATVTTPLFTISIPFATVFIVIALVPSMKNAPANDDIPLIVSIPAPSPDALIVKEPPASVILTFVPATNVIAPVAGVLAPVTTDNTPLLSICN